MARYEMRWGNRVNHKECRIDNFPTCFTENYGKLNLHWFQTKLFWGHWGLLWLCLTDFNSKHPSFHFQPTHRPDNFQIARLLQNYIIIYYIYYCFELPFFSSKKTCTGWAIARFCDISGCHNHITWYHEQIIPIICSLSTMSNITHCYLRQVCTSLPFYLFDEVDFATKINSHSHYCPDCTVHPYRKKLE